MLPYSLPNTLSLFLPNIKHLWFLLPFLEFLILVNEKKIGALTMKEIILKGSIIAIIVTVPSIAAFLLSWNLLNDLIMAAIIGAVVHFIAMGFSLKISKKILIKK